MYEFEYTNDFLKSLKKLDLNIQSQVKLKVKFLVDQENPIFYAKRIKGYKHVFRFRVGDYRIIFRLDKNVIRFFEVAHRKDIYDEL